MGKEQHKDRPPTFSEKVVAQESHTNDVDKSLTAIFRDSSGAMPDLSKMDRRRSHLVWWVLGSIASFIVILIVAIWLGFSVFKPFSGFKGQGLQITVDGPERVALGQETTYFINYQNISPDPLANSQVQISFPPDFTATSLSPQPTSAGLVWELGSIPLNGRGTITVKGIFSGALGTNTAIQVVGTYRPAQFNSDFEQLATKQISYSDTVLSGAITVPVKALPGDKIHIQYQLQNLGTDPQQALEARVTLPQGFVREASSSAAEIDESIVKIPVGTLAPGATSTVEVVGSFASGVSGNLPVHAEIGHVGSDGIFNAAQKADATISVLTGDLSLNLVVNGSDASRSVGGGDPLRFSLAYQNTATEEIKGITLRVIFEPVPNAVGTPKAPGIPTVTTSTSTVMPLKFVDWSALENDSSGTVSGNTITWTKDQVGELERLPPQADGTTEFSLPVMASGTPDVPFQVSVQGTMEYVGDATVTRMVVTKPIVFHLRTDADITAEARYFSDEGVPFGTGPLPPVVGQTTNYRIHWQVSKTVHELSGIKVSASLPRGVTWPNNAIVSAGIVSYDEASSTVTWTLNRLPANIDTASADFDVQLTPAEADAGRFADLLGETRFDATDAAINEAIVKTKPGLTTDLQNDEGAKNKGVVKKP